jgi:lipopolysaccharide export system permease protein
MNLRPHVVDLYLARTVLLATLGAALVIVGFDLIGALVKELDDIEGGYTLSHAFLAVAYTLPRRLYEAYPTVAMIGCVLGLGGLASRSELTAMRAIGMSRLRIGAGALSGLGLVALLMIVNAETVAPFGEQSAQG